MSERKSWRESLAAYAHPRVRAMLLLGFSSGLVFPLVLTTLSARLRQAGIDRTTIGLFSLVGLMFSLKFFWSPIVDRLPLPLLHKALGRRRSWMLLSQCAIVAGLLSMAFADPGADPAHFALLAVLTALAGSTQDIAIDAWRIEAAEVSMQGLMAAAYQIGYQLALIAAGAGALASASALGWQDAYLLMTGCMSVGILTALFIGEPQTTIARGALAREAISAVVSPFVDFFKRYGLQAGVPILALILTFRLNYMTMGVAANTFYLDTGYTLDQIAVVSKVYGVIMTLTGGLVGGVLVARIGLYRSMLVGWALLTIANLIYGWLATQPADVLKLAGAISVDNLGNGIAGGAFIAYMSSLTNRAYTATQYALFGTLWSLPAKSLASAWGAIVDAIGYPLFFCYTAAIGLPSLVLILYLMRRPLPAPSAAS
ncbi:MAG TPA: MFS transporter [Nevskiaceae bacterium]|nr:MFS transporter [Nevskiaceae bacterium]